VRRLFCAMTVTREDLNPCTVRLTIVPASEQVKHSFDRAFRDLTKKVKLPGFRPGKAPRAMLEPLVNKEDLYEEAARALVMSTLNAAIKQESLTPDPNTQPSVDVKSIDQDTLTAEYSAKIPLPPRVELGDYTGLSVVHAPSEVTPEEVDLQIEEMRRRRSVRETVTSREVRATDIAVLNIKPDGAAEGKTFMVIVGKSFPQLDELILGMQVEEIKHAELTFPAEFSDKEWAGTTVTATVAVSSLTEVKLPDLDDAFAASLQTENLEDLRERVTSGLQIVKEEAAFEMATDQLLDTMVTKSTIEVSDNMWENLADRRISETAQEQAKNGISLEQYTRDQGMTIEEFVEAWRVRAKTEILRAFVIQNVYAKEKLNLTNGDVQQELARMAGENNISPEELYRALERNGDFQELQFRAIQRKVRQFLLSQADVRETEAPAEEATPAPKKKSSKKKAEDAPAAEEAVAETTETEAAE